jgi:hypothetical protein
VPSGGGGGIRVVVGGGFSKRAPANEFALSERELTKKEKRFFRV